MIKKENTDIYPHLLFDEYLQAGKILSLLCMLFSLISTILLLVSENVNMSAGYSNTTSLINLLLFIFLLAAFRNYLLNFELPGIRKAVIWLIIISVFVFIINKLTQPIYEPNPEDKLSLVDSVATMLTFLSSMMCWACYLFIGIVLCRYKNDFIGGLQRFGLACIIIVSVGIIMDITYSVAETPISMSYTLLYKIVNTINCLSYMYMLYTLYCIFKKAEIYKGNPK